MTAANETVTLSHVPKQSVREFVSQFGRRIAPGSHIVYLDNSKSQLNRLPITGTDSFGNTYQSRELESGSTHQVLKNFPTKDELLCAIDGHGIDHEYLELEHYWLFRYIQGS